jgi:hypothetical protein
LFESIHSLNQSDHYFLFYYSASFAALTISATNLTILAIMHGQELGWVCLASCSTDVVVNAVVLFWLTRPGKINDEQTSNSGPASNYRIENGKSGAVHMNRISANPVVYDSRQSGSFIDTSSINGMSKTSTGPGASPTPDDAPRSPLKVSFSGYSHTGVYDGSRPRVRDGLPPSGDDKTAGSLAIPNRSSLVRPRDEFSPYFEDQKRQTCDFVYERKVTIGSEANGGSAPTSFLSKFIGKRSPSDGGLRSFGSTHGAFGGRRRNGSDDGTGVHITITTTHENDHVLSVKDIEASHPTGL